jgi:hypothetical protein
VAEKVLRVKTSNPIVRTILTEENAPINEEEEVTKSIAEYFKEVYAITEEGKEEDDLDQLMELVAQDMEEAPVNPLFTPEDIEAAIDNCNFNKGLGPDGFDGNLLTKSNRSGAEEADPLVDSLRRQILLMLNNAQVPEYLREGRLIPLSKNKGKAEAQLKDIRPIIVRSHIAKVMEKALLAKIERLAPHLLKTGLYQTGFKEGHSTAIHVSKLLEQVHPGRGKSARKFAALIDLQKAYDTVNREKLWGILRGRCQNEVEQSLVNLIIKMHQHSTIKIGNYCFDAPRGVVQGAVLSPFLFNVYLDEALKSSKKLKEVRDRGDLLAFADDMLILTNSKPEMGEIIRCLEQL